VHDKNRSSSPDCDLILPNKEQDYDPISCKLKVYQSAVI